MLKSPYRLIALFLLLVLAGLAAFSQEASAKKPKKKKAKTEMVVYTPPTLQLIATPTIVAACAGEAGSSAARVQLDAKANLPSGATPRYKWSASGGHIVGEGGIELQNEPTATAYVIVYPGRGGKPGDVQKHTTRIFDYLVNSRGIDGRRIVTRAGPIRGEPAVELWICPQGAKAPSIE